MRGLLFLTLLTGTIIATAHFESSAHRSRLQHMNLYKAPCKAFSDHWRLDPNGEPLPRTRDAATIDQQSPDDEAATDPRAARHTRPTHRL